MQVCLPDAQQRGHGLVEEPWVYVGCLLQNDDVAPGALGCRNLPPLSSQSCSHFFRACLYTSPLYSRQSLCLVSHTPVYKFVVFATCAFIADSNTYAGYPTPHPQPWHLKARLVLGAVVGVLGLAIFLLFAFEWVGVPKVGLQYLKLWERRLVAIVPFLDHIPLFKDLGLASAALSARRRAAVAGIRIHVHALFQAKTHTRTRRLGRGSECHEAWSSIPKHVLALFQDATRRRGWRLGRCRCLARRALVANQAHVLYSKRQHARRTSALLEHARRRQLAAAACCHIQRETGLAHAWPWQGGAGFSEAISVCLL